MLPTSTASSISAPSFGGPGSTGRRSAPMSSTGAEWVSAPTARKSTPVAAYGAGHVAGSGRRRTPAGSGRPPGRRPRAVCAGVKLSSRTRSAPASTTSASCSSESTSTSTGTPGNRARTASNACGHPAGRDDVVVLDQCRVPQAHPVVHPAAAADRVLLQRAQAGRGLAGVADPRAGARDARRPRARSRSPPRTGGRAGSAPCARTASSDAGRSRRRSGRRRPRCTRVAVGPHGASSTLAPPATPISNTRAATGSPATTPAARAVRSIVRDLVGRHGRHRRHVDAAAEVLGERGADEVVDRAGCRGPRRAGVSVARIADGLLRSRACGSRAAGTCSRRVCTAPSGSARGDQADAPGRVVALREVLAPVRAARLLAGQRVARSAPRRPRAGSSPPSPAVLRPCGSSPDDHRSRARPRLRSGTRRCAARPRPRSSAPAAGRRSPSDTSPRCPPRATGSRRARQPVGQASTRSAPGTPGPRAGSSTPAGWRRARRCRPPRRPRTARRCSPGRAGRSGRRRRRSAAPGATGISSCAGSMPCRAARLQDRREPRLPSARPGRGRRATRARGPARASAA